MSTIDPITALAETDSAICLRLGEVRRSLPPTTTPQERAAALRVAVAAEPDAARLRDALEQVGALHVAQYKLAVKLDIGPAPTSGGE